MTYNKVTVFLFGVNLVRFDPGHNSWVREIAPDKDVHIAEVCSQIQDVHACYR